MAAVVQRCVRERLLQCLLFEAGGWALVVPLWMWASGAPALESLALMTALSAVMLGWSALFNTLFDRLEARLTGRVASARPHPLRLLHALALEASAVALSLPVIVAMTPLSWGQALAADIALTLVYAAYGYAYHWAFDRWRPVRAGAAG